MKEDFFNMVQDYFIYNPCCTLEEITKVNPNNYWDDKYDLKLYMNADSEFPVVHEVKIDEAEIELECVLIVRGLYFPVTDYDIQYLYTPPLLPKPRPAKACIRLIMVPLNNEEEIIQRITEWRIMNKERKETTMKKRKDK